MSDLIETVLPLTNEIEKLRAENKRLTRVGAADEEIKTHLADTCDTLTARNKVLEKDRLTLVLMGAQSIHANVIEILNDWVSNSYATEQEKDDE